MTIKTGRAGGGAPRGTTILSMFLILAACLAAPAWAADRKAADRAFAAGDTARALELYDQVLKDDPSDVEALIRSAKLLSWSRRFDEALDRYARVLKLDPDNRTAAEEQAKVLSWAGRYDEASAKFLALLKKNPGDRNARLGLARTLSWSGRQERARREYQALLKADPNDPEAMVGMAQTYAWSAQTGPARAWYRRALEKQPESKAALLGLAYLDLEAGDPGRAASRTRELEKRFPDDREVAELSAAVRRGRAPWVRTTYDRLDDTDGNDLNTYRVESGGWPGAGPVSLSGGVARYRMRSRWGTGSVDSVYAVLGWIPASGHRLRLRLGADRRQVMGGESATGGIGGVSYHWDATPRWTVDLSAARDTFRYSPEILANDVVIDSYRAAVTGNPGDRWRVRAVAGAWDLSDGNGRTTGEAGAWYRWPAAHPIVETGYRFYYMDYDQDLDHGYFDPSGFTSHVLQVRVRDRFGARRNYYDVTVEAGIQSFDLGAVEVRNDTILGATGVLGFPLGKRLVLEIHASRTDYAAQNPAGFTSRVAGIRLRWQGGG